MVRICERRNLKVFLQFKQLINGQQHLLLGYEIKLNVNNEACVSYMDWVPYSYEVCFFFFCQRRLLLLLYGCECVKSWTVMFIFVEFRFFPNFCLYFVFLLSSSITKQHTQQSTIWTGQTFFERKEIKNERKKIIFQLFFISLHTYAWWQVNQPSTTKQSLAASYSVSRSKGLILFLPV